MMQGRDQAAAVFVGRQNELSQLHRYLGEMIQNARSRLVLIQGDYGLGKTTLVTQFVAEVASSEFYPGLNIGKGECMIGTQNSGLAPFIQLLRATERGIPWRLMENEVWDVLNRAAPAWLNIVAAEQTTAAMAISEEAMLAVRPVQSPYAKENVFVQFANTITELSQRFPILLWIEDLHWADEMSLELLDYLANRLRAVSVLIIGTYRPVEGLQTGQHADLFSRIRANLVSKRIAVEMALKPDIDTAVYVTRRYPENVFPQTVIDQVAKHSAGHPMFLDQLFSSWQEREIVRWEASGDVGPKWRLVGQLDCLPVMPPDIGAVLDQRIRLLNKELQDVLERGSVEGEEFTVQLTQTLLKLDEQAIWDDMQTLEHNYRLVHGEGVQRMGDLLLDLYRFEHRFFREHIYQQLAKGKRRSFHRQVGEAMERLYPNTERIAGPLAQHFREAGEFCKAANYALAAARLEQKRYCWPVGEYWCRFGLDLVREMNTEEARRLQVDLLQQSGEGFYDKGEFGYAADRFSDAVMLAESVRLDPDRIASLYTWMADTYDTQDEWDHAMEAVQSAKEIMRTGKKRITEVLLRLLTIEGLVITRQGRNEEAARLLRQVVVEVERRPTSPRNMGLASDARNCLGVALSYLGRYTESTAAYRKAVDLATCIEDPLRGMAYTINLVDDLIWLGRLDEAETLVQQLAALTPKYGDEFSEAYALATRGSLLVRRCEYAAAIATLHRSLAKWRQCGAEEHKPYVEADLASAHLGLSELEAAYKHGERGVQQARDNQVALAYALDVFGQVKAARGDWDGARATYEQSISVAEAAGIQHYVALAQRHFADLLLTQGDRPHGLELLARARQAFLDMDLIWEIANTEEVMAKWGITPADLSALADREQREVEEWLHQDDTLTLGEEGGETAASGILAWMGWEAEDVEKVESPMDKELESLRQQLAEMVENLRLIEERKAEFVLSTDVPLQLVREERRSRERVAELEAMIQQREEIKAKAGRGD